MAIQSPSLDNIETSAFDRLPSEYRQYRTKSLLPELHQTEAIYLSMDSASGTHKVDQLTSCRSFAWFARDLKTGQTRVFSNACKLRWCPICSQARSMFIKTEVSAWTRNIRNAKFLTLTMQHTNASLAHQIKWLYRHFRLFRQRKAISPYISGGIWFFQLKKSASDGCWHPHLHCILDSEYIPQKLLSEQWELQTMTSNIVDIKAVTDSDKIADYVARYCARPARLTDYTVSEGVEIVTVFHGKRLCGTWGTGRACKLSGHQTTDRSNWVRIGAWKHIIKQLKTSPRARAIVKSWQTNSILPAGITLSDNEDAMRLYVSREPPDVGIEDINFNWRLLV